MPLAMSHQERRDARNLLARMEGIKERFGKRVQEGTVSQESLEAFNDIMAANLESLGVEVKVSLESEDPKAALEPGMEAIASVIKAIRNLFKADNSNKKIKDSWGERRDKLDAMAKATTANLKTKPIKIGANFAGWFCINGKQVSDVISAVRKDMAEMKSIEASVESGRKAVLAYGEKVYKAIYPLLEKDDLEGAKTKAAELAKSAPPNLYEKMKVNQGNLLGTTPASKFVVDRRNEKAFDMDIFAAKSEALMLPPLTLQQYNELAKLATELSSYSYECEYKWEDVIDIQSLNSQQEYQEEVDVLMSTYPRLREADYYVMAEYRCDYLLTLGYRASELYESVLKYLYEATDE